MSRLESWSPIRFDAATEIAFSKHMLGRILPLMRLGSWIGIVSFAGYQLWDLWIDPDALGLTGPIRLSVVALMLVSLGLTHTRWVKSDPRYLPFLVLFVYLGVALGLSLVLSRLPGGFAAGMESYALGMIFVPVLVSGAKQAAGILLPYFAAILLVMFLTGASGHDITNAAAWTSGGVAFCVLFAHLLDVINRRSFHLENLLAEERQRSEELLLNVLPADIAARLKAEKEPLADSHDTVSVLFADLAGFTDMSRKLSPEALVNLLNDLFSRFDRLVEQHGAEKIKTIGDAYMVATGLTGGGARHAEEIADLALDMRRAFNQFRDENALDLKIRIGAHSGPVVAGVIGKRKFSYDLWGDSVNVASRMESEGVADGIQISEETKDLLPDRFRTAPRGEVAIKGHRPRATFILEG